ncbi:unnamed protein product [Lactuca virosa]|uniref:Leucine-rich repeat-containing N-terminal plant-type domain-containing protein n=1 Tax=Lactuca virosa TaxID=75947 RepID=A0AAU9PS42_9ASTR|nr:unnamed protein product [Lactuca virosa]
MLQSTLHFVDHNFSLLNISGRTKHGEIVRLRLRKSLKKMIKESDFQALQSFKQELIDPNGFLKSWNDSGYGAQGHCAQGQVIVIQLPWRGLGGRFTPKIGQFQALRKLSLHDNAIEGSIPKELGFLPNLRGLQLFNNRFTDSIPPALGSCPLLQTIDLSNNSLVGVIPESLANCSKLCKFNNFSGALPDSWGNDKNGVKSMLQYIIRGTTITAHKIKQLAEIITREQFAFGCRDCLSRNGGCDKFINKLLDAKIIKKDSRNQIIHSCNSCNRDLLTRSGRKKNVQSCTKKRSHYLVAGIFESKKTERLSLPKDAKDNFLDFSSNIKASFRSNSLVDISSSSKGASSVKLVKVKRVAKVISSMNEDDDFVRPPDLGQFNVKNAEITYRNPSGLVSTIYRIPNDIQKVIVKDIGFGFLKEFVVKKFCREICSWVLER